MQKITTDFLIVGSGFGGTILAMGLAKLGYKVMVVERKSHPRFTIGESSTPIADMILRCIGDKFELPFLKDISRYGTWQKRHPELTCGLKRGFSYYYHQRGNKFTTDDNHSNELLVAASKNDENSDTNWLRSDVDHFFVQQLEHQNVLYADCTEIKSVERNQSENKWKVKSASQGKIRDILCNWIVDATGSASFSNSFFGAESSSSGFETNSSAIYTHIKNADRWLEYVKDSGFEVDDYPYNPDHSALHHILEEGWMWMLRFNNDLLSAGILIDRNDATKHRSDDLSFKSIISQYPSLMVLFKDGKIASPPGEWIATERLQRKLNQAYGEGWVALPHTVGFVDPLHSTGIAHTLTGVEKLLDIFSAPNHDKAAHKKLKKFEEEVFNELSIIDLMVSCSYYSRRHFPLFKASVMLYFAATIRYEQERLNGTIPDSFLCAGESQINQMVGDCHQKIKEWHSNGENEDEAFQLIQMIKKKIKPYNKVGLMDASKKSMYQHTAVTL